MSFFSGIDLSALDSPRRKGQRYVGLAVFLLAFGLFASVRFWHLSYYCLDGDEIFSLDIARQSWSKLLPAVIDDLVHPPLSYIFLKIWISIGGEGLIWLRLFPTLLSIGTVVPFWLLCREIKLAIGATSLALFFIGVNGYLIYWAHDIRMYSMVLFLTLFSLWLFVRFYSEVGDGRVNLAALFAINLILIYTHYFGFLLIGTQFIFLLLFARRRVLAFAAALVVWIAAFAPWIYAIGKAAAAHRGFGQNLGWITRPGISELIWFYSILDGDLEVIHTTLFGLLLFGGPVLVLLLKSVAEKNSEQRPSVRDISFLIAAAFLPVTGAFVASQVLPQSVWGERHLIVSSVPYFVAVAAGVFYLQPALLRVGCLTILACWSGFAGYTKMSENSRPAWDRVTFQMIEAEPQETTDVTLYTYEEVIDPILEFYLLKNHDIRFHIRNVENVDAMAGKHFWVALRTPAGNSNTQTLDNLKAKGYRIGYGYVSETPLETVTIFPVWEE